MSKKRGAEKQITKDNDGEDDVDTTGDGQQTASESKLASRQMVKVKRKVTTGETDMKGMPKFNFAESGSSDSSSAAAAAAAKPTAASAPQVPGAPAPAAAPRGFFAAIAPGSWQCPACDLTNKKEAKKCISCEEPNPAFPVEGKAQSSEAAVADAGISFGSSDSSSGSAAAAAAAPAASTGLFGSFGSGDNAFTFGGDALGSGSGADSGSSLLSFGAVAESASTNTLGDANPETENQPTGSEEPNPNAELFKGKKAESSGEEGDTIVHKVQCRVYVLKTIEKKEVKESPLPRDDDDGSSSSAAAAKSSNGKSSAAAAAASNGASAGSAGVEQKYVEVGSGELHINKFKADGATCARLVLRAEKVQRLVVNAPLLKGMSYGMQQEKYVRFISLGLDEPRKMTAHLLRFKTKADAVDVHTHMGALIAELK